MIEIFFFIIAWIFAIIAYIVYRIRKKTQLDSSISSFFNRNPPKEFVNDPGIRGFIWGYSLLESGNHFKEAYEELDKVLKKTNNLESEIFNEFITESGLHKSDTLRLISGTFFNYGLKNKGRTRKNFMRLAHHYGLKSYKYQPNPILGAMLDVTSREIT